MVANDDAEKSAESKKDEFGKKDENVTEIESEA